MTSLISIGTDKQLFLDEHLLERVTGAVQVLNTPAKQSDPVIRGDRPWEGNAQVLRAVLFDDREGVFKLWYDTSTHLSQRRADGAIDVGTVGDKRSCLAVSTDGLTWEKPALGLTEFEGSRDNNILPPEGGFHRLKGFFLDPQASDPERRFVGMERYRESDPELVARAEADPRCYYAMEEKYVDEVKRKDNWGSTGWNLYHSPDGLSWSAYEGNPVRLDPPQARTWSGPARFMGWDPIRQCYAVHMESCQHARSPLMMRLIGRSESPDMVRWTRPETIIVPDADDPSGTQFYYASIRAQHGIYVGVLANFFTESGLIVPQFVFSRDGIRYDRRFRDRFVDLGADDDFDAREMYAEAPLAAGDRHLVFYTGRVCGHMTGRWYEEEMGPENTYAAIGMAILPRDGFVSLDAGVDGAEVVTRAFTFEGDRLEVDVDGLEGRDPEVEVEVLGPAHHYISGLTRDAAVPIRTPGRAQVVRWRGGPGLDRLRSEPIKLRFHLRHAKLFAFRFT